MIVIAPLRLSLLERTKVGCLIRVHLPVILLDLLFRIPDSVGPLILALALAWFVKLNAVVRLIVSEQIRKLWVRAEVLLRVLILASSDPHSMG